MISSIPKRRPSADAVLKHPFFWDAEKQLNFFQGISDRLEKEDPLSNIIRSLNSTSSRRVLCGNWRNHICPALAEDLRKFRTYKGESVVDLLRAMRNKKHHYRELPTALQRSLGPIPASFVAYFTSRFPSLLLHVYVSCEPSCAADPMFSPYYSPDARWSGCHHYDDDGDAEPSNCERFPASPSCPVINSSCDAGSIRPKFTLCRSSVGDHDDDDGGGGGDGDDDDVTPDFLNEEPALPLPLYNQKLPDHYLLPDSAYPIRTINDSVDDAISNNPNFSNNRIPTTTTTAAAAKRYKANKKKRIRSAQNLQLRLAALKQEAIGEGCDLVVAGETLTVLNEADCSSNDKQQDYSLNECPAPKIPTDHQEVKMGGWGVSTKLSAETTTASVECAQHECHVTGKTVNVAKEERTIGEERLPSCRR